MFFTYYTIPTTFDHAEGNDVYLNDYGYQRLADDIAEGIDIADANKWFYEPYPLVSILGTFTEESLTLNALESL